MNVGRALLAKVTQPQATLIGRAGLVDEVAANTAALVWIVGPAGSGKTSLGLEYSRAQSRTVAWLRLDEADSDPASFLHYLRLALQAGRVADEAWEPPQLLREHLPALQGYLRLFLRSLSATVADDAVLVLDDAHKCQEAGYFRQFLEILSEELPSGVRCLVLSRSPPPEACTRLLAHGLMQVVNADRLSFSPVETEALLSGLGIEAERSAEIRDAVFNYTHGWPAGIALVASWLLRRPEAAARLDEVSQLVAGYLASEVFSVLSATERDTLLSISFLPYFRTEWANTLVGGSDAAETLGRLSVQGALIYQYPGRQFTLHPLFQQFLRARAQADVDPSRLRRWIEQCVALLDADGSPDAAVELALEQGATAYVAQTVALRADALLAGARHQTLGRWISGIPEQERGPWHNYWLGLAYNVTDTARAREAFLKAYDAFTASGNLQHRFVALSMIIVSYSFNGVARESLKDFLQRIGDVERDFAELDDVELRAHLTLGMFSGLTTTDPGHPAVERWEQRALEALSLDVSPEMKARLAVWMSIHWFFSGQYRRITALRRLLDSVLEPARIPSYQRYLVFFLSLFDELVRGDHDALSRTFAAARQASEDTGFRLMDGHYALQFGGSCLLKADIDVARGVLARVASITPPGYYNQAGHLQVVQGWVASWSGDAGAAAEFAERAGESGRGFGGAAYALWSAVGSCIAGALRDDSSLPMKIAELRQLADAMRYHSGGIHADLLDAWRLLRAGDSDAALPFARSALARLGRESEGFLWGAVPQILQPVCVLALERGIELNSATALVRFFRLSPPPDAPEAWPWALRVRSLGGFEFLLDGKPLPSRGKSKHRQLEVVKLLAAMAPAPQPMSRIAELLWPDSEGDAARHALETTLSRLRTTFGRDVFRIEHGAVSLDPDLCDVDTVILDRRLSALEAAASIDGIAETAESVIRIYRGDLLAGDGAGWLLPRREYWRGRLARTFGAAVRRLEAAGEIEQALRLLEHAVESDPYSEALTTMLMRLCLERGRFADGLAAYRRFRRVALSSLGAPLSAEIESLALRLQNPSA